jgi:BON domain
MNLPPLPEPTAFRCRRSFAILRSLAAALGIGGGAMFAAAADPEPGSTTQTSPVVISDVVLSRAALAAIDADPELRGLNVLVSVVDHSAVIGGPVASKRQMERVEQLVRAIPGISDVRNTCFISLGPDPLLRAVAERLSSSLPPRPAFYELPGVLTPQFTPASVPPALDPLPAFQDANTVVIARKPTADAGVLGAPVGSGGGSRSVSGSSPVPPVTGVLTASMTPSPGNPASVLAAANEARQAEARFAKLTVELRDGTLMIGGSAPLAADAWDFAKKVRVLPGVSRVAIGASVVK